ncbi:MULTISPECIES: hypothetical protein [unclassified Pseudomonas]|uniref:hypothetical protein n=1 Tax=unclassified Pseudomonas TaxID=196821 RepID=UPI002114E255|nr:MULTISPECIES: hypothetical protein [unclassified Pseudomonas]
MYVESQYYAWEFNAIKDAILDGTLGELSKDEARELWHDIDSLRSIESPNECWYQSRLLTELFGEEWHYPLDGKAVEENHKFTYLRRVVEAVQQALRQEQQAGMTVVNAHDLVTRDKKLDQV